MYFDLDKINKVLPPLLEFKWEYLAYLTFNRNEAGKKDY